MLRTIFNFMFPTIFIFMGVVLLMIAVFLARKCLILIRRGVRTQGVVVDMVESEDREETYPIVEFLDLSGIKHQVRLSVSKGGQHVGMQMGIIYHQDNPGYCLGTSFTHFWLFPILASLLGSAGVLLGVMQLAGFFN